MNAKQRRKQARAWYSYDGDAVAVGQFRYPVTPAGLDSARRELTMLRTEYPRDKLIAAGVARAVIMISARLA